jgi:predicted DCC family thiol-disulfide oxidoreductase YuxK
MTGAPAQSPNRIEGAHLVLYDGVCGLCSRVVQFLLKHDRRAIFAFASLQSPTGRTLIERFGGDPDELTTFVVLPHYRAGTAGLLRRSGAALFVARELGWPWKAALALRILPAPVLDFLYDIVARTRYRVFGRLEQCLIPSPEFRRRFIDA